MIVQEQIKIFAIIKHDLILHSNSNASNSVVRHGVWRLWRLCLCVAACVWTSTWARWCTRGSCSATRRSRARWCAARPSRRSSDASSTCCPTRRARWRRTKWWDAPWCSLCGSSGRLARWCHADAERNGEALPDAVSVALVGDWPGDVTLTQNEMVRRSLTQSRWL